MTILSEKQKNIIVLVSALILLGLAFFFGYRSYPKLNPTIIKSNTILIHDTIEHHIVDRVPYYIIKLDTIIFRDTILNDVDSAAILKDYFAWHYYNRQWNDSLLSITLKEIISENKPVESDFSYKILRPQQIINNVINNYSYSRYFYIGLDIPVKDLRYAEIGTLFAFRRGFVGIGYVPLQGGISLKGGVALFKLQ